MTPTNLLLDGLAAAMGADTVTFVPKLAAAQYLIPIKVPFTPGPTLTLTDATDIADFDGSTAKIIAAAVRTVVVDPLVGGRSVLLPPPAGGFRWTTTGVTNLPQTIYGVVLSNSSTSVGTAKLEAALRFDSAVVLTATGQTFEQPEALITIIPGGIQ